MPKTGLVVGVVACLGLVLAAGDAAAQPGQTPSASPGYSQPSAPVQVTQEEYAILMRGEYTSGEVIAGGLVGSFWGLGLGHAIQGRWGDDGWKFTFGEIASVALLTYGAVRCLEEDYYDQQNGCNTAGWYMAGGFIGYAVFRIWELIDVWHGPIVHNKKLRELRWRTGYWQPQPRWSLFAAPSRGDGAVAGIKLRF